MPIIGSTMIVSEITVLVPCPADGVLPAEFAERFRKGVRGSRVELVPGCGHLPQQECPESVSRALFGAGR